VRRLGVAEVLGRQKYTAKAAARLMSQLLSDNAYPVRAAAVAAQIAGEDGAVTACDALEAMLKRR
jgi:UDP:flavonoid glycosyltransferase YjiC (YdhE family)